MPSARREIRRHTGGNKAARTSCLRHGGTTARATPNAAIHLTPARSGRCTPPNASPSCFAVPRRFRSLARLASPAPLRVASEQARGWPRLLSSPASPLRSHLVCVRVDGRGWHGKVRACALEASGRSGRRCWAPRLSRFAKPRCRRRSCLKPEARRWTSSTTAGGKPPCGGTVDHRPGGGVTGSRAALAARLRRRRPAPGRTAAPAAKVPG